MLDETGEDRTARALERVSAERAWQLNDAGQPTLALEDTAIALQLDPTSAGACAESAYALDKLGRGDFVAAVDSLTGRSLLTRLPPRSKP